MIKITILKRKKSITGINFSSFKQTLGSATLLSLGELSSCAFSISSLFVWIGSAGTLRLSFSAFLTGVRLDFLRPRFGVEVPLQKKVENISFIH